MRMHELEHFYKIDSYPAEYEKLREQYGDKKIIVCLKEFISQERKKKIEQVIDARLGKLRIAIEAPYDMHNAMAALRSAEAMGVTHMHLIKKELKKIKGKQSTGGSWKWTSVHKHKTFEEFYDTVKTCGWKIAGAFCDRLSYPLDQLSVESPLILLFGNEKQGLSDEAKRSCDLSFHIPMYGMVSSYNLSISCSISLYVVTQKMRKNTDCGLPESEKLKLEAIYIMRSIGVEKARLLLQNCFSLV